MPRGIKGSGPGGMPRPSVSRNEQEVRWRQLRDLLYPQVTTTDLLRMYLEANDWDVARAHAMWDRNRARIMAGEVPDDDDSSLSSLSSTLSSSLSTTSSAVADETGVDASLNAAIGQKVDMRVAMEDNGLPFNANIEQERRDAALAFRMRIESVHEVVLSISEAVLLLYLADWDTGVALAEFQSHEEARNRLRIAFDSFRRSTDDLNEQSARLAAMLDICERNDWLSVKLFLEEQKYRFIRAVISWYKSGIPPFEGDEARSKTRPHWGLRVDQYGQLRKMPSEEDCRAASNEEAKGWAHDTVDFRNPGDTNPPTPHLHSAVHGKNYNPNSTKERAPGFFLHAGKESFIRRPFRVEKEKPDTVQPGPADSSKFLLEYISKGQYKFNLFKLEKYFFSDRADHVQDDARDEEDADDPDNDTLVDDESSSSTDFDFDSDPSPSKINQGKRKRTTKSTGRTALTPRKRAKTEKQVKPCVEFDFNTPSHLADLNNWRRQNGSRIEGRVRRLPAQHWSQEELDLLYKLSQEWYENLKRMNPRTPRRQLLEKGEVLTSTKKDWARQMNERFTGTFPRDTTGRIPKNARHDRKETALMTMRGRYAKLAVHFRIKMDQKWLKRIDPAEIARLEAERDALESEDNLLTAVAQAAAEATSDEETKVEEEAVKEEDDENKEEDETRSDVAERGDDDRGE
ncbi:hypothetical protein H2200_000125 [Cladophialophora chaetospira]|uniref:Uncharacterized protein n=1 Tax=Cladophialophora chaetospira TaxID=386627 RepID=A0AA39CQ10_9EURO|nr:hypothetical protein H2200_000125 [Cladophialophora chaetospira]